MPGIVFDTREGWAGVFVGGAVRLVVLGIVFETREGERRSCGVCYPPLCAGYDFSYP